MFDDTRARISVLNLSSTAVNTFDFKTTHDAENDGADAAQADQMAMLTQLMRGAGGPAGALGQKFVTPLVSARAASAANTPSVGPEEDTDGHTDDKDAKNAAKLSRARERSSVSRKRRAFRRESRSRFRRDWRLAHARRAAAGGVVGPTAPLSSSPRAFAGFEGGFGSDTKPRARDMHHTRYGQPPNSGGFSDLFGAHLGAAAPAAGGRRWNRLRAHDHVRVAPGGRRVITPGPPTGSGWRFPRRTRRSSPR